MVRLTIVMSALIFSMRFFKDCAEHRARSFIRVRLDNDMEEE